ncbi:S8 family serine peptidase, partial [Paenibacillus glucanolyticus]
MIKLNRLRKPLSMGLSLLLAASFIHPVSADNTSSQKIDMKSSLAQIATDKVSNKLSKQFEKDDYVTYLVKMKEQVDTASVSKQAMEKATLEKQTPSATKLSVRTSVVSSLRETASRTQYTLERYLDKALDLGKVKEYKSYFIVNALAVTSTQEVMEEIALLPEVDKILPNEERFLQKAEVNTKDASTEKESSTPKTSVQEPGVSVIQPAVPKGARDEATNAPQPQTENVEWNIDYVNAPEVWERGIDGTGIVVANLDSGVDYTHPALNRKWRGYDASGNIVDPELSWYDPHSGSSLPADGDGHGTHTMGTMVGSEEDGSNQIGVAPG